MLLGDLIIVFIINLLIMGNSDGKKKIKSENENENSSNYNELVLLGDSVLDNFYWLDNKKEDVEFQMNRKFKKMNLKFICSNLALDETETHNIFNGKIPSKVYSNERIVEGMKNYEVEKDGYFRPLNLIKEKKPSHALLSIGGNDARVSLSYYRGNINTVIANLLDNSFEYNYNKALDEVIKLIPNVIVVIVYRPGPGFILDSKTTNDLYNRLIPILLKACRERNLPVIDLSRTFDPNKSKYYGSTPIEPSNFGGEIICDLTIKVLEDFKFQQDKSKIYYGENIKIEENNDNYSYLV